jgi:uncharacterized protein (DUF302 family)
MNYAHTVTVTMGYEQAVQKIKESLATQGFGILSEINVRSTFEAKLGTARAAALGDYLILGACSPALADRALSAEPDMGLLLPCNIVIRRGPDATQTIVQAIDPMTMMQLSDSPQVHAVAKDADTLLRAALHSFEANF